MIYKENIFPRSSESEYKWNDKDRTKIFTTQGGFVGVKKNRLQTTHIEKSQKRAVPFLWLIYILFALRAPPEQKLMNIWFLLLMASSFWFAMVFHHTSYTYLSQYIFYPFFSLFFILSTTLSCSLLLFLSLSLTFFTLTLFFPLFFFHFHSLLLLPSTFFSHKCSICILLVWQGAPITSCTFQSI